MSTCTILLLGFGLWLSFCVFLLRFLGVATAGDEFENSLNEPCVDANNENIGPSYPANRPVVVIDGRIVHRTREPSDPP